MSIWPRLLNRLLPQDCLLCGGGPATGLLCDACQDELQPIGNACPVCADAMPGPGICGACLRQPRHFDATQAALRYVFPADKLVQALKYQQHLAVAGFLADQMLAAARPAGDLLLPMPLSARRLRERGYNQAMEIARPLARATGLPLVADGCRRSRDTTPQATLPWQERGRNVRGAFDCVIDLTGKSVIVVDDVMTSGATLEELASVLKARGATRVHNWVACRAIRDASP